MNSLVHATNIRTQRVFLEKFAKKIGISEFRDWKKVSLGDLSQFGGAEILKTYNNSILKTLQTVFPEKDWRNLYFGDLSDDFWSDVTNQRKFFDFIAKELQISKIDDWYNVSFQQIVDYGGLKLVRYYSNSISKALNTIYEGQKFISWKFRNRAPNEYANPHHQRKLLDRIASRLGILKYEDWYSVSLSSDSDFSILSKYYGESLYNILQSLYPEMEWKAYKFSRVPSNYWSIISNRRAFFDDAFKELRLRNWEDWYKIRLEEVEKLGGAGMLREYYQDSLIKALSLLYPENSWKVWKFDNVGKGFWQSDEKDKDIVEWIANKIQINKLEEWYNVTDSQLNILGVRYISIKHGGLINLLRKVYPVDFPWDETKRQISVSKAQSVLFRYLSELFPNIKDIFMQYPHPNLKYKESQEAMEFDVFIPALSLAFEYQGKHHFESSFQRIQSSIQSTKDAEKMEACRDAGITLIEIPYWWDQSIGSLHATIYKYRPEIISHPGNEVAIAESISPLNRKNLNETGVISQLNTAENW